MGFTRLFQIFSISALLVAATIPSSVTANDAPVVIEAATGPTLSRATGHWHRARTHLRAAIREFDKGNELVDPQALMDAQRFRTILLDRVVDLDRVLSPQPRVSEAGVRYDAAPELIGHTP